MLVFERFRRGTASATKLVRGTGLGLALVAEHARLHGGSVDVEPGDPGGCRFVVLYRSDMRHANESSALFDACAVVVWCRPASEPGSLRFG
ncbi:MAG: sensor histidine kinase [Acidimicrobiales bacterium]